MRTVLVEGWRHTNQSLAMVNQYQLLELLRIDGLSIFHRDLPYTGPTWGSPENGAGFPPDLATQIDSIPPPPSGPVETLYRIGFPYARSASDAGKIVTFIVTEFGLRSFQFSSRVPVADQFCRDEDLVVTPSNWSKMKLVEYGFPDDKVQVIPHGVNADVFHPLSAEERLGVREELGIAPDEFVFLNIGSLTREKGLDALILAFAEIRRRHARARLLLKDMRGLYGLELEGFLAHHIEHCGPLAEDVLGSIYRVEPSLSLADMRSLYGAADVYVSAYRAEGFNLPVIEAIACGLPVIVSRGGATDDYCDASTALMIECDRIANGDRDYFGGEEIRGYHLEPRVESIIEQMEAALSRNMASSAEFARGRAALLEGFSWQAVTSRLAARL